MKHLIVILLIISSLFSCDNNNTIILPGSNGRQNEVMIVINHKSWEGKIGSELKKIFHANVLGLPLPEPKYTTRSMDPQNFTGTYKYYRNILKVTPADSTTFTIKHNLIAKPQVMIFITGPSQQAIIKTIQDNAELIVKTYKDSDIKSWQKNATKNPHKSDTLKLFKRHQLFVAVPRGFNLVDNQDDFIWFRKRFKENGGNNINGSMNVIAYTLPLEVPFSQIKDSIISIRNSIGQRYIPGGIEGSYLITEDAYTPHIFDAELAGKKAYKTQGKWDMKNDYMAGPFVSYTIEDKENNRLIVVEGLTYAPSLPKRDFMFELEAIIRTLTIK